MTETKQKFRLGAVIKDPYLSNVIQARLDPLTGAALGRAQEVVEDLAASALVGDFADLKRTYTVAIAEAVNPNRKRVHTPHIDRGIMKNPTTAARIDRELEGATAEEVQRANDVVRRMIASAKSVEVTGKPGEERLTVHPAGPICKQTDEHSTIGCGHFKDPGAWVELFVEAVRQAVEL